MRRKLLYRINRCVRSYQSYDDRACAEEPVVRIYELILRKHQVSRWNPAFNLYLYILPQNKMIKLLGSLLQRIGQNCCMNFIEIVHFSFSCIFKVIVLQWFILCYFNDSFYIPCTLWHFFSPSFLHELLFNLYFVILMIVSIYLALYGTSFLPLSFMNCSSIYTLLF